MGNFPQTRYGPSIPPCFRVCDPNVENILALCGSKYWCSGSREIAEGRNSRGESSGGGLFGDARSVFITIENKSWRARGSAGGVDLLVAFVGMMQLAYISIHTKRKISEN
jgi:hypothetical protein